MKNLTDYKKTIFVFYTIIRYNMNKEIQEHNEAMFDEVFKKIRYLFARVDLKDRENKTSKIVDYLTKQLNLNK